MSIIFRPYRPSDKKILKKMVLDYYQDDPPLAPPVMDITKTINELRKNPSRGQIWIIEKDRVIAGYSIVINYWSNEWNGNFLIIDELYIVPNFRNQKLGSSFIKYLIKKRPSKAVGITLEIHQENLKVLNFYKKIGFQNAKNKNMEILLPYKKFPHWHIKT